MNLYRRIAATPTLHSQLTLSGLKTVYDRTRGTYGAAEKDIQKTAISQAITQISDLAVPVPGREHRAVPSIVEIGNLLASLIALLEVYKGKGSSEFTARKALASGLDQAQRGEKGLKPGVKNTAENAHLAQVSKNTRRAIVDVIQALEWVEWSVPKQMGHLNFSQIPKNLHHLAKELSAFLFIRTKMLTLSKKEYEKGLKQYYLGLNIQDMLGGPPSIWLKELEENPDHILRAEESHALFSGITTSIPTQEQLDRQQSEAVFMMDFTRRLSQVALLDDEG